MATTEMTVERTAQQWLDDLGQALEQGELDAIDRLFQSDGYWRDLLAFTWDLRTFHGSKAIGGAMARSVASSARVICRPTPASS